MLVSVLCLALAGCAAMATNRLAANLGQTILNHNDPDTVMMAAPAYMLMLDGFIIDQPGNEKLLLAGARLYGVYASVFVDDENRARRLAARAREYGQRAMCLRRPVFCEPGLDHAQFAAMLNTLDSNDVPALFGHAAAWAGWIQANRSDWAALADLPRVEAMLQRVVSLDENHENGQAHYYLGIIHTRLPSSLGGKPGEGRRHFERAIALSGNRNLMAQVELARRYARMLFDRPLHDRLLQEVLQADPRAAGFTLGNTLAQRQARQLLDSGKEYFGE